MSETIQRLNRRQYTQWVLVSEVVSSVIFSPTCVNSKRVRKVANWDIYHSGMDRLHKENLTCTSKEQKGIVFIENTHSFSNNLEDHAADDKGRIIRCMVQKLNASESYPPRVHRRKNPSSIYVGRG